MPDSNNQQSSAPIVAGIIAVAVVVLFLGGMFDRFLPGPDDDGAVISGVAESVYRGELAAAKAEAAVALEFADDLERDKFESPEEFNDAFTKAMDDARRDSFRDYGRAMESAMKAKRWESEMAEILRDVSKGFSRFSRGGR